VVFTEKRCEPLEIAQAGSLDMKEDDGHCVRFSCHYEFGNFGEAGMENHLNYCYKQALSSIL
jgi:hypothetical protein